ncbi:hypothetical protein PISMIDRAFT_679744 [Pisolithus microcarpus 441]|uniref:Uncharacterized protein n=1 Tax=Pisolithus microcarpus 441 TaxID=765257 RepID=A0A0C9ZKC7_9AGAM|nr:hypothetical protein PISMIDRAFT_679744 [Pisolithus microcarpus 441]
MLVACRQKVEGHDRSARDRTRVGMYNRDNTSRSGNFILGRHLIKINSSPTSSRYCNS